MRTILSGLMATAIAATAATVATTAPASAIPMTKAYVSESGQTLGAQPVHWRRHYYQRPHVRYYRSYDPYYYRSYPAYRPYYGDPYYHGWRRYHRPGVSIQFGF